jgi:CubicO group peptidase (beta-lactamase class C family)
MSDLQQQVQETIDELVESGAERGLQVAVYRAGEQLVDAVAGTDATGRTITNRSPVHAMSTDKSVAATVVHVLAERGALSYDTRIAEIWPEFGAHGKDRVTLRDLLVHTVGLPYLPAGTTTELMCDWDAMCTALAAAAPEWEPGT